ncbi:DUF4199 domain-containing protein [Flavobacteriales bacterium]|jgi:hypothetical protein|nr:DUF4199 domain-containing protein [Flavobacteriales bacterium]MDA9863957.1 DUF4199 domain-containing protein [Flavobacteriales bacterium]
MNHNNTDPAGQELQPSGIPSLLFGHSAAGAGLVLSGYLLAYMIRFEALLGHWSTPFVLTVVISVMVMVLLSVRQEEGRLSFGRAFGLSLLSGFLVRLGYNIFMVLLFHVMRPDLVEAYVGLVLEKTEEALLAFNLGGLSEQRQEMMEMAALSTRNSLSLTGQFTDALVGLIWLAFVAAIVSLILKRKPVKSGVFRG